MEIKIMQNCSNMLKAFTIMKFLGKGSYGSVYDNIFLLKCFIYRIIKQKIFLHLFLKRHAVRRIADGKLYALKEINIKSMSFRERFSY